MLALIPCTFTIYITISYHLQKNKCASLGPLMLVILFFIRLKPLLHKVKTNKQYPFATNKDCKPLFSRLEQLLICTTWPTPFTSPKNSFSTLFFRLGLGFRNSNGDEETLMELKFNCLFLPYVLASQLERALLSLPCLT